jgi:CRP-like cAMP-binding protein
VKDDVGKEMYFIAEGTVYIIADDKRTVLDILGKGRYFGEMAIFLESNIWMAYVQAKTFCNIMILKKKDLDVLIINFPTVKTEL